MLEDAQKQKEEAAEDHKKALKETEKANSIRNCSESGRKEKGRMVSEGVVDEIERAKNQL